MAGLVTAYRKRDGVRVQIPAHWLDHPRLGAGFTRTPAARPVAGKPAVKATDTPAAGDEKE